MSTPTLPGPMPVRRREWLLAGLLLLLIVGGSCWYLTTLTTTLEVDASTLLAAALADLERGRTEGMERALQSFEDRPEYEQHVRLMDAALFVQGGRVKEALEELALVPPVGTFRQPVLLYTARCLYQLNRLTDAEDLLLQITRESPDDIDAHRWLGIIYYDLGAYDPAIAELQHVARLHPEDYRPHRLMGLMCRDFERTTEAIGHYEKALHLDPPDTVRHEVIRELAKSQIDNLDYAGALSHLDETTDDVESQTLKAKCLLSTGQLEQSAHLIETALRERPDDRDALLLKAELLLGQGDRQAALETARKATTAHPNDAESWYQLGLIYAQMDRPSDADSALARWQALKDLQTRLTELNVQALNQPFDAAIREELADLCDALGKSQLASRWRMAAAASRTGPQAATATSDTMSTIKPSGD